MSGEPDGEEGALFYVLTNKVKCRFMCFVHMWFVAFFKSAMAPALSANNCRVRVMGTPMQQKNNWSQRSSCIATVKAIYSASIDEST